MKSLALFVCVQNLLLFCRGLIGDSELSVISASRCPKALNGKDSIYFDVRLQRKSRTKLRTHINVAITVELSDDFKLALNVAKATNQGWKDNFLILEHPKACQTAIKYVPGIAEQILNQTVFDSCPIPPGNYSFDVDLDLMRFSGALPLSYGNYRPRLFLRKDGLTHFCCEGIIKVGPKAG